jgi:hypothetical protein
MGLGPEEFLQLGIDALKDRGKQRDSVDTGERSMKATVEAFNVIYHTNLTESMGWAFMVLLKLVRGSQGTYRDDDYIDAAAYCALLGESESKRFLKKVPSELTQGLKSCQNLVENEPCQDTQSQSRQNLSQSQKLVPWTIV